MDEDIKQAVRQQIIQNFSSLTDEEKESNKTMMICCSGSHSDELKLDI